MSFTGTTTEDEAQGSDLQQQVADLNSRLHLTDVRVQRLQAEAHQDPPFDVHRIQIHMSASEVLLEPPRFAARFSQTVELQDSEETTLAHVEVAVVVDYTLDDGPLPSGEAVTAYVENNSYFAAHPYLRETLQSATLRLGLEPVVLGVLGRGQPRPTEINMVRRVPVSMSEEKD
ncbi:hypothetical protein [Streptomyces anulatus]|uniref:hypothetical protein n=1 Tax=Streptomyces anulatus TaxID=1892 RepID=UPI0036594611